jgi:photosystem II stability/assembly factor-like uncharacterized protein
MIDEERMSRLLQRAIGYEPPGPGFGAEPAWNVIAARRIPDDRRGQSAVMALVAALLAVAIIVTFVVGSRALRPTGSVPGHAPVAPQTVCYPYAAICPLFISGDMGWIAQNAGAASASPYTVLGPYVLSRTVDGGRHWTRQLTWTCPAPTQILFSADGRDGVVVSFAEASLEVPTPCAATIFRTSDGGAHWQRFGISAMPNQAPAANVLENVFFLDSHEGWAHWSNAAGVDEFVHTIDGGVHWTPLARLDWRSQFGYAAHGQLAFRDSSNGFLLPYNNYTVGAVPVFFFVTHDGGVHWQIQRLTAPANSGLDASNAMFVPEGNSQVTRGALEVAELTGPPDRPLGTVGQPRRAFVYTTQDGGDHWAFAAELPDVLTAGISFIDWRHWIGQPTGGGLIRTDDAGKHWNRVSAFPPPGRGSLDFADTANAWTTVCPSGSADAPTAGCLSTTSDGGAHWTQVTLPSWAA